MSLILVLWLSFQTSVKPGEQKVAFIPYLQASQAAIARDLLAAAERMPAEHYGFKPTPMPAARTFAAVIGHAADGMFDACARIRGLENPAPGREKALIAKAEIVRALRASIEFCDAAFSGMTEATLNDYVRQGPVQVPKAAAFAGVLAHNAEMFGISTVYLRANNIVPPGSDR